MPVDLCHAYAIDSCNTQTHKTLELALYRPPPKGTATRSLFNTRPQRGTGWTSGATDVGFVVVFVTSADFPNHSAHGPERHVKRKRVTSW